MNIELFKKVQLAHSQKLSIERKLEKMRNELNYIPLVILSSRSDIHASTHKMELEINKNLSDKIYNVIYKDLSDQLEKIEEYLNSIEIKEN